ncbi:MAG: FtsX-like permease family protein, partial [Proteobacteria bacterium]
AFAFTIIAVIIACLGLYGLATFTAAQRTKEIGIRKVLGASVPNIIGLLSKDFATLVIVATIIASPLAWLAMHQWLNDFAYRINIDWTIFAIAGLGAIIIAVATVTFQAVKSALANPVKSLRTE